VTVRIIGRRVDLTVRI